MLNLTPYLLDSDENDYVKLSCSSYYIGRTNIFYPRYVFDKKNTTGWNYEDVIMPNNGHWLKMEFVKKINVRKIIISNASIASVSIKDFILYGSDDDLNYDTLLSARHPYIDTDTTESVFDINNSKSYYYYRINILSSHYSYSTKYGGIGELKLFGFNASSKLVYKDNNYYNTDESNYNQITKLYNPINPTSDDKREMFSTNSLNLEDLTENKTIGDETFKPIDKLFPFRILEHRN